MEIGNNRHQHLILYHTLLKLYNHALSLVIHGTVQGTLLVVVAELARRNFTKPENFVEHQ